jgi:hypothetical protein
MVYNIMYIPGNFLGNYIFDKFGMRKGMQIGISLTIVGAFLRVYIYKSFHYVVIGNLNNLREKVKVYVVWLHHFS